MELHGASNVKPEQRDVLDLGPQRAATLRSMDLTRRGNRELDRELDHELDRGHAIRTLHEHPQLGRQRRLPLARKQAG